MAAPRRTKDQIERDWYGCFAKWSKQDRAAALKVLSVLHDQLPENPRAANLNGDLALKEAE